MIKPAGPARLGVRVLVMALGGVALVTQAYAWVSGPLPWWHDVIVLTSLCLLIALVGFSLGQERSLERARQAYGRAESLRHLNRSVIAALASAINLKDVHSHRHVERVTEMAGLIAREMGLSSQEVEVVETAALLHDVGKLAVPEHILSKPSLLTPEERKKVETHPRIGVQMLHGVSLPPDVLPAIEHHHERWDGTGYPEGVSAESIPLAARVIAVANVFDALISPRPYRPPHDYDEAVDIVARQTGTAFDPDVVRAFLRVARKDEVRAGLERDAKPAPALEFAAGKGIVRDITAARQELYALYEIVQTMGRSLNLSETLSLVVSKTKKIIDYDTCIVFLVDENKHNVVGRHAAGLLATDVTGLRIPLGEGVSGSVVAAGRPSRDQPAWEDLRWAEPRVHPNLLKAALSIPLRIEGEVIGALTIYHEHAGAFQEDHQRLLTVVAEQAAKAIDNALKFEKTEQSALTDTITGLPNARYFYVLLDQELNRARREGQNLTLVALDIDDFKSVNDRFGHQAGDTVLRDMADIFRRSVRDYDTVARHAGDEFFLILPGADRQEAEAIVGRISSDVAAYQPMLNARKSIRVRVSIGLAIFPHDGPDMHTLIAAADQAMYADKRAHQQRMEVVQA